MATNKIKRDVLHHTKDTLCRNRTVRLRHFGKRDDENAGVVEHRPIDLSTDDATLSLFLLFTSGRKGSLRRQYHTPCSIGWSSSRRSYIQRACDNPG